MTYLVLIYIVGILAIMVSASEQAYNHPERLLDLEYPLASIVLTALLWPLALAFYVLSIIKGSL